MLGDWELADYEEMLQLERKNMEEGTAAASFTIAPNEIRLAKRILNNRCGKEEGEANISLL
jgi:hypothetical protein